MELSSDNNIQFWIPEGFAHGFLTLSLIPKLTERKLSGVSS